MDLQRLGKMMPDSAEVFQQLQQAASLCLGSPEHGLKVCVPSLLSLLVEIAGNMRYCVLYTLWLIPCSGCVSSCL